MGGVSSGSGEARQLVAMKEQERRFNPQLRLSCGEDSSLHGSESVQTDGNPVTIPALGSGGGGPGGGGGDGRDDGGPTDPLGAGGCMNIIQGLSGPDTIDGTAAGDLIDGAGGGDVIRGRGGHDCLIGSRGRDRLFGGPGRDRLTGGSGGDLLAGGGGKNAYNAGSGADLVKAANRRSETVRCGSGVDRARVDPGDTVRGCEQVNRV